MFFILKLDVVLMGVLLSDVGVLLLGGDYLGIVSAFGVIVTI